MHICHVSSAMKGGPEVIVSQLSRAQLQHGGQVSVIYSPLRDSLRDFAPLFPQGVEFISWEVGRDVSLLGDYNAYRQLHAILSRLNPTIVHLHNAKAGAHGRLACRRLGIPNIYSPHGLSFLRSDVGFLRRMSFYMAEWFLALLGDVIVPSSKGEHHALTRMPGRKQLINNGLDVGSVVASAQGEPVLPKTGRFRLVIVGRMEEQKNPDLVAEIAALSPPDWEWIWVGDGSRRPILERSDRINIVGWLPREAAFATVRSADVFLQASRWEGMSFALLEAMALGRPCVVSDVPGNRDLVVSDVSGFICRTPEQYLDRLKHLAAEPGERERLGNGAARSIREIFSYTAAFQNWSDLYASMLHG